MKLRRKYRLFLLAPLFAIAGYAFEPLIFEHDAPQDASTPSKDDSAGKNNPAAVQEASGETITPDEDLSDENADSSPLVGEEEVTVEEEAEVSDEPILPEEDAENEDAPEENDEEGEANEDEDSEDKDDDEGVVEIAEEVPFVSNLTGKVVKPYQFSEIEYNGIMSPYVWRNPRVLKNQLASSIQGRLKSLETEDIMEFIKNPESRLLIAQWELLNRVDIENFKEYSEFALDEKFRNELGPLFNNLPWITGLLYDGETKNLAITLDMLRYFREEDPNMDVVSLTEERGEMLRDQYIKRRIAAAVAAEFTNKEWYGTDYWDQREDDHIEMIGITPLAQKKKDYKDSKLSTTRGQKKEEKRLEAIDEYAHALERYKFFADGVDQRLLNTAFYSMPNWLMRFPCGWNADKYGTIESMEWMRQNNSVPIQEYANIFSQVPYIMYNDFGYHVDNEHYYHPKVSLYPYNHQKHLRDVGAVCVGQAHYAVGSASANGVPAFVVSEPNHNSYAIFYEGEWHPCNSGSTSRTAVWDFWSPRTIKTSDSTDSSSSQTDSSEESEETTSIVTGGSDSSWNTLTTFTRLYQDGQKTRDAQLVTSIADMLCLYRNENSAIQVYEVALGIQPLLRPTWDSYLTIAMKPLANNPTLWLELNAFICKLMAEKNPATCSSYLREKIYPKMLKALKSPRHKMEAFGEFFLCLKEQEENPWDIDQLLEAHHATLKDSPSLLHEYYSIIAKAVSAHPEFGTALTWAIRKAYDRNKNDGLKLMEVIDEYREDCENKQLFDSAIIRAAEQITANRIEDKIELFKKYSEPYLDGFERMPNLPKVKGNLISDKAIISLSSYNHEKQDLDAYHAGALTEKGGLINSRAWQQQTLTLELEDATRLGDIIIVPNGGSAVPYYMWTIQISKDGKTWEQLAKLPDNSTKSYIHVHIKSQNPTAKYIKIESGMSMTQGIQFKAVLIYDNKNR